MKIHILMHESFEAPGAILDWTRQNNIPVTFTKFYENQNLPEDTTNFDLLIIMGGPQSPETEQTECPHFDAYKEINFIKQAILGDKYVLGICLGAQLIGEALGYKYQHSPQREIGVFPLKLTPAGKADPIIGKFPENFLVGHWHGDMPGVHNSNQVLAFSAGCPNQIVRYSDKVYGFQCHFEFTKETVNQMIQHCSQELEKFNRLTFVQNEDELMQNDYQEMNKLLFLFLDHIKDKATKEPTKQL